MWIWLILSLLLVIACIIFGIHSFLSSRTLQRSISVDQPNQKINFQRPLVEPGLPSLYQQEFSNVKIKLKSIEGNSIQHAHQLNELQKRIEALEASGSFKEDNEETKWNEDDEDWEKLYYQTRNEKESLEENLNLVNETLHKTQRRLEDLEKQKGKLTEMKTSLEQRSDELHILQNTIGELQRKLEGATEREKELEKQIAYEKFMHGEYELLQKQNNQLRSEADDLRSRFEEISAQNILTEQKLKGLTELESTLEISEYEKLEIKNTVEQIIEENMALSAKLQELQYKLIEEKKYH
jgi:chromosome segregation ATPase